MKLYIVIVSFNGGETLAKLINDLIKESGVEIVVVENGDKELGIKSYESRIKLIRNDKNLGFAKGANIGIKYALQNNADRILVLNQDVVIESGFLNSLIANKADIVSPLIKFKRDDKWLYDYGGKVNWWLGRTSHYERSDTHPRGVPQAQHHPWGGYRIDYVSGCAMLVKREVFEKIGLFDERFFLYFEDADFCLRAKKEGFTIDAEPKSIITHQLIEGKERSNFKKWHLLRSNFLFINKYLGVNRLLAYLYLAVLAVKIML